MQSNPKPDLPLISRLQQDLKSDLIAGLLVVIPLATTFWLATTFSKFVLAFLTSVPKQFNPFITLNPYLQDLINLSLGLTVPLLGILLIGLMAAKNLANQFHYRISPWKKTTQDRNLRSDRRPLASPYRAN